MMKPIDRADVLNGASYKIRSDHSEHAIYVIINNAEINGQLRPVEIFINSKSMEDFQYITCITRLLSAILRHASDEFPGYAVDELLQTYDIKKGSYTLPNSGGQKVNGLVHHIGLVLQRHCEYLGIIW